jgi:hypothetical protein
VVSGNTGGGVDSSTLNNCTITDNSGWGASSATLNNCIVYFNSDPSWGNYDPTSTLNYCCTTPMPTNGVGNITADPQLASASHLSAESPCIGAGSATYASGMDIDGEAWANPPSIGCDEYHAGAVMGPLTVSLTATLTNVSIGFPVSLTAFIEGRTDLSVWEFGDGFVQVNEPYTSHAWTAPGDYLVALWVFNESYPAGVSATLTVHVEQGLHYVAATSGNPVAPYTTWATAATNIQDAVDVAAPGATVLVTNGTYVAGGRTTPSPGDGAQCERSRGDRDSGSNARCDQWLYAMCLSHQCCDVGGLHLDQWCGRRRGRAILRIHQRRAFKLRAERQLGDQWLRRRGLWRHAQQLHVDRQLGRLRWRG